MRPTSLLGQYRYDRPILLTEHGIYTREREEEIIRSNWVLPSMKDHWIKFFYLVRSEEPGVGTLASCFTFQGEEPSAALGNATVTPVFFPSDFVSFPLNNSL